MAIFDHPTRCVVFDGAIAVSYRAVWCGREGGREREGVERLIYVQYLYVVLEWRDAVWAVIV